MWHYKDQICKVNGGKRPSPSEGAGIMSTLGDTGAELFIEHGIPWLGKKALEQGRYFASEFLRQPKYQKKIASKAKQLSQKGVDYAIDALSKDLLNKASDKLRPKNMKRGGKIDYSDWYPMEMYTDVTDPTNPLYQGGAIDIHKLIGKLPRPKAGFTPSKYKYMGPYNPLDKQLEYDKDTGEVTKWHVQPYNKVDEIAAHHDICYDMGKNKGDCDKKMVESLDNIPYGEMPKWGQTARFFINTKQKLGLGVKKPKNVKSRRVKKTGKKN